MAKNSRPLVALVMSGGGARAAYQVGVLKAVSELMGPAVTNPFPIICGTSAGAINAATIAVYSQNFRTGVRRLNRVWRNFRVNHVFRADPWSIIRNGARWLLVLAGGFGKNRPAYLLDRDPLAKLLSNYLSFEDIQTAIDKNALRAISITASGYGSGESVSFFQGADDLISWRRARRIGVRAHIELDHLLASSAIPFIFRAIKLHREFFGDGSMRQTAPLSPALHLGAEKLFVIGVNQEIDEDTERCEEPEYPSLAQIIGHIMNSIFLDSLNADLERLERINKTVRAMKPNNEENLGIPLREVSSLVISPSEDLGEIAQRHAHQFPRTLRFFLKGIGAINNDAASLVSYLLFESSYCRELINLGYADAMQNKDAIIEFMEFEPEK